MALKRAPHGEVGHYRGIDYWLYEALEWYPIKDKTSLLALQIKALDPGRSVLVCTLRKTQPRLNTIRPFIKINV